MNIQLYRHKQTVNDLYKDIIQKQTADQKSKWAEKCYEKRNNPSDIGPGIIGCSKTVDRQSKRKLRFQ